MVIISTVRIVNQRSVLFSQAFLTYQLTVGFCFLVYLQFFHLIKSKSCKSTNLHDDVSAGKRRNDSARSKGVSATPRRQSIGRSTIWVDMTSLGDIFTHPETSLFLRIGTLCNFTFKDTRYQRGKAKICYNRLPTCRVEWNSPTLCFPGYFRYYFLIACVTSTISTSKCLQI